MQARSDSLGTTEDRSCARAFASSALLLSLLFSHVCGAMADNIPRNVVSELAPSGKLRVAINFGNTVLAQKDAASGEPRGVSAELARELAKRLAVPIEFVTFDAAGKVVDALANGAWDIAFLAIDPVRGVGIDFTAPYVLIEGAYVVPKDSPLKTVEDVDRDGVRVAVARASADDLYLTRGLKHAKLVREANGPDALALLRKERLEAPGAVKQPSGPFARGHPASRRHPCRVLREERGQGNPTGLEAG